MRVAFVVPNFPSESIGGLGLTLSFELARGLQNAGHELLVIARNELAGQRQGEEFVAGIRVWRKYLDTNHFQGIFSTPELVHWLGAALDLYLSSAQVLADFNPDVVECFDWYALGLFFALDKRYPLVVWSIDSLAHGIRNGHMGTYPELVQNWIDLAESTTVKAADAACSLSNELVARFCTQMGGRPEHYRVIKAPLRMVEDLPVRTADSSAFPRLMYWGAIQKFKGCDLLIDAIPQIAAQLPRVKLTIAGRPRPPEDPYLEQLRGRVDELGISDKVEFVGELPREQLIEAAVNSDLCVFPSRYETACYACLEAMSYGCCVIAAAAGALPEYVDHGRTGWVIPVDDTASLVNAVVQLSNDEMLRRKMGEAAQQEIRKVCDPDRAIKETEQLYREVILSAPSSSADKRGSVPALGDLLFKTSTEFRAMFDQELANKYTEGAAKSWELAYNEGFKQGLAQGIEEGRAVLPPPPQPPSVAERIKKFITQV